MKEKKSIKAKTYQAHVNGKTYLVEAQTTAGALRDVLAHVADELSKSAVVDLATGEQIYAAGVSGNAIIGAGRFKQSADPNQMGLTGIPETAAELL